MIDTLLNYFKTHYEDIKPFIPVFFTLLGVIITLIFGIIKDWYKEYKRFKIVRQYFLYCLNDLRTGVTEQIKLHNQYISILLSDENSVPSLAINIGFTVEHLEAVTKEDLYKIIITKRNKRDKSSISHLSLLLKGYGKIKSIVQHSERESDTIHSSNKRTIERFGVAIQALMNENMKEQSKYNDNDLQDWYKKMLDDINKIGIKFAKKQNAEQDTKIEMVMNVLINPIKKVLKKNKSEILSGQLGAAVRSYSEFRANRINFVNKLKRDLFDLENTILPTIIIILEYNKDNIEKALVNKETQLEEYKNSFNNQK